MDSFWKSVRQLLAGKSVLRVEHDLALASLTQELVPCEVLELGAKPGKTEHLAWLPGANQFYVTTVGLDPECHLTLNLDEPNVNVPLVPSETKLCIATNLFEHLKDPTVAMDTICSLLIASLKPGSQVSLIGSTPFVHKFHPDPHDFWRPTQEGIALWFSKSIFELKEALPYGVGPFTVSSHVISSVTPIAGLRAALWAGAKFCDWVFRKFSRDPAAWYLGIAFRADLTIPFDESREG